jgi:hypothetical protein
MSSFYNEYTANFASCVGGSGTNLEQERLDLQDYNVDEPRTFASSEEQQAFLHFESNLRIQAKARNDMFLQENALFQVIVSPPFASVAGYDIDHMESDDNETTKTDHRCLPRSKRVKYDHGRVMSWIQRDYLGPKPMFDDREFDTMFRISSNRFQR